MISVRCASLAIAVGFAALPALAQNPQEFVQKAVQGDNSEIMLGHVAERHGGDPAIRRFGHTLVADHSMARDQAMAVASRIGVQPPRAPDPKALREKAKLENMGGPGFDREFAHYMVRDHEEDIVDFRRAAHEFHGPAGRMAREQLPTLYKHLHIARLLANNTGRYSQR